MHTEAMGGAELIWIPDGFPARSRRGGAQLPWCWTVCLDSLPSRTFPTTLKLSRLHTMLLINHVSPRPCRCCWCWSRTSGSSCSCTLHATDLSYA
ncbi:hypothetical protein OH77DRAFT_1020652 [Trametes cingulata]|nr:hypothetical protein OH77DRAFT_1020652 [Trametes cingulata]